MHSSTQDARYDILLVKVGLLDQKVNHQPLYVLTYFGSKCGYVFFEHRFGERPLFTPGADMLGIATDLEVLSEPPRSLPSSAGGLPPTMVPGRCPADTTSLCLRRVSKRK